MALATSANVARCATASKLYSPADSCSGNSSGARVAAQDLRQVLRKRRARHHHVASGFLRLHLQLALHVRDEANDVGRLLQLRLQFWNHGERLGAETLFRSKMMSAGLSSPFWPMRSFRVLLGLDEFDLHVHLARRLLDLGQEEQVVDEGKDARRRSVGSQSGSGSGSGGMNCLPKFWPVRPPRLGR